MRTAEEIFEGTLDGWLVPTEDNNSVTLTREELYQVINQARKEALEEVMKYIDETDANVIGAERKILSLIQELH